MRDQTRDQNASKGGAEAIWAKAADWLAERAADDWTAEKQAALDTWLAESTSHLLAYLRIEAAWDRTNRLVALRTPMRAGTDFGRNTSRFTIFKVAAAVVAVCTFASLGIFNAWKPPEKTFATPVGGREIVTLSDGSTIELNTNTELRLAQGIRGRQVRLDRGEAYFQIRHDADHPFVVIAGDHRVTDLGTKFVVRRDADRLKVSLLEGSARVEGVNSNSETASATLTPGDVAVATADTLAISKRPEGQLTQALSWRHGLLVFRNTPLSEVVAELNRYNDRKIVIADADTAEIGIGGTFPANNTHAFVRIARELLGLRVTSKGDELVISR